MNKQLEGEVTELYFDFEVKIQARTYAEAIHEVQKVIGVCAQNFNLEILDSVGDNLSAGQVKVKNNGHRRKKI